MSQLESHLVEGLTEIFRVLGDPTRVRILDALSQSEMCVGDLAMQLGVSESAVSHQLRLLRNTRIVRSRREGRMIFYALDDKHVLSLFRQGLRHVQESSASARHPRRGEEESSGPARRPRRGSEEHPGPAARLRRGVEEDGRRAES